MREVVWQRIYHRRPEIMVRPWPRFLLARLLVSYDNASFDFSVIICFFSMNEPRIPFI